MSLACPLPLVLALLLVGLPAAAADERVWLEITEPAANRDESGPVGLIEVKGWAGAGRHRGSDIVIALDLSGSTLLPSGGDVDGDGRVGRRLRSADDPLRNFNPRRLCSDAGDTVRAAEIEAARRFVQALDLERSRVGLLAFSDRAKLWAPVGSSREELLSALNRLSAESGVREGSTNLAAALELGVAATRPDPAFGEPRERWLVLLSDGAPQGPGGLGRASEDALRAASAAGSSGVRVHAVALGEEALEDGHVYRELASVTGGSFTHVARPSELVEHLARLDLSRVARLELANRSSGVPGRAVRLSPDGRFGGLVPLVPGTNRIRVTAWGPDGAESSLERVVRFESQEIRSVDGAREALAGLDRLRARTQELELAIEVDRARARARDRMLDLQATGLPDVAAPPP